jgi:hypothetical protein
MCAGSVQRLLAESIVALVKTPGSIRVSSSSVRDGKSLCFWRGRHFGEGHAIHFCVCESHRRHPWGSFFSYCRLLPPREIAKSFLPNGMVGRGGGDRTHIPNRPPPFTNRGPLCGDFFDRNYRLYRDSARSTLARSKLWVRRISKYPSLSPKHSL